MRSEMASIFPRTWQFAARLDQLTKPGDYVATYVGGGEPVVVVRDEEGVLRAFSNVCRHHAARVGTFYKMFIFYFIYLSMHFLYFLLIFYMYFSSSCSMQKITISRGMWPHC